MARPLTHDDLSVQRMRSASVRAQGALSSCRHVAERLDEALDDVTAPHALQTAGFDEEDSVVTTVAEAMSSPHK